MMTRMMSHQSRKRLPLLLGVTAAMIFQGGQPAKAESVEQFYAGKQVKLIVGGGVGGGYDFYGRVVTRFMSRYLPGHPTFVASNMPGAGGIIAANYLYNIAPRDGSEIAILGRAVATQSLLNPKDKAPRYTATNFNWIGTPQQEVGLVLARRTSNIRSIDDLKRNELVVSGTSPAAPPSAYPRLLNKLLGTKFKVIDGYKSSQEALLAMERGEVEGHVSSSSAAPLVARIKPWIDDGRVSVLAQIAMKRDGRGFDAPLITELAATPVERQLLELVLTQQVMAWPIAAPPGVPPERVNALRAAFDQTMHDPDFLSEAARLQFGVDPVSGEKLNALLTRIYATPKDMLDQISSLTAGE
jgi:tripartite-type tricarboxylate transporter receptor subunit TctC